MQIEIDPAIWEKTVRKKIHHKPKVLLIGNVANNAYQIAKLLNKNKIDCDVMCNDYYHIMGCPEWEDADIEIGEVNQFYPKFCTNGKNAYKRPKWFAQGPFDDVVSYLITRRRSKLLGLLGWNRLEKVRTFVIDNHGKLPPPKIKKNIFPKTWKPFFDKWYYRFIALGYYLGNKLRNDKLIYKLDRIMNYAWHKYRKIFEKKLIEDWNAAFPDRIPIEWSAECDVWLNAGYKLQPLLKYYDIVIAFGGSVLLPYFAGFENYIAFEHGTIRYFGKNTNNDNNLLMLAYAQGKVLYNTNTDCYDDAEYITQNTKAVHFCGLHGIGMNELFRRLGESDKMNFRNKLGVKKETFLIFCPARHNYKGDGKYIKGDEIVKNALEKLAFDGYDFVAVMINWGDDAQNYKKEIDCSEALRPHIIWSEPLSKHIFEDAICTCDIIVDQFTKPVFGALAMEALVGRSAVLISYPIDENIMKKFFSSKWPIFEAMNEDELKEKIKIIISDREMGRKISEKQFDWVYHEHASDRIARLICGAMQIAIGG